MVIRQDFVAIKSWSENTGIEQALIDADVVCSKPVEAIRRGVVSDYICGLIHRAKEPKKTITISMI